MVGERERALGPVSGWEHGTGQTCCCSKRGARRGSLGEKEREWWVGRYRMKGQGQMDRKLGEGGEHWHGPVREQSNLQGHRGHAKEMAQSCGDQLLKAVG